MSGELCTFDDGSGPCGEARGAYAHGELGTHDFEVEARVVIPLTVSGLRESGLLWYLNRCLFHPRGMQLCIHAALSENGEPADEIEKLSIVNADDVCVFSNEEDDQGYHRFAETLREIEAMR